MKTQNISKFLLHTVLVFVFIGNMLLPVLPYALVSSNDFAVSQEAQPLLIPSEQQTIFVNDIAGAADSGCFESIYLPLILKSGISNSTAGISGSGSDDPILAPIGNQCVRLGHTLRLTLSANAPQANAITFSASPMPLPDNMSLNSATGAIVFKPDETQVGSFAMTFSASDGQGGTDSETITITVEGPEPGGVTTLTGQLLDTNNFVAGLETPVVGATVSLLDTGHSTTSDTTGHFTLIGIPAGSQVLDINTATASPAPGGAPYAGFREEIKLFESVTNVVDRPFFLPRIAVESLTPVNPNGTTVVNNPTLGISLTVPPNTAKAENGSNFTGDLSISEVAEGLAPAALPEELEPGLLITIQPVGVTFATPVPITFPNTDNLPPGSETDLWSLDPEIGGFVNVGVGRVSADGSRIETISGGVRATDWHFFLPPSSNSTPSDQADGDNQSPENQCQQDSGSTVVLYSGCLRADFSLPPYLSLSQERSPRFVYKANRANPHLVIPFDATILFRAAVPPTLSYEFNIAGLNQGIETFVDTSGLNEGQDETIRGAVSFDASAFNTGVYSYGLKLTSNYAASRISSQRRQRVLVVNEQDSTFGAGWGLEGLQRLYPQPNDSVLLIDGNGLALHFSTSVEKMIGPSPYSSAADSPFNAWDYSYFHLDDLEDGLLNTPGVSASTGNVIPPGFIGLIDSVDADDGLIDGSGLDGHSLFSLNGPGGIILTFDQNVLGTLPTHAGIVWTDGGGTTTFEAFDDSGVSLGTIGPVALDDGSPYGTTADDNFFGMITRQGISAIHISNSIGGIEVDHIQYGAATFDDTELPLFPPPGDFSNLVRNDDGAYTRTLKDGTQIHFNVQGLQTAVADRNGNTTSYAYDANDRLTSITDPVGLVTRFTYSGDHLRTVTDPAGRTTTFQHDAARNLTQVTFPDGSSQAFGYDNRHLMTSETDARGFVTTRTYDSLGKLVSATLPEGTVRQATNAQVVGWVDPASGLGTPANPAPRQRPNEAVSTFTDGQGRTATFETGRFGEATRITDAAGLITQIDRDLDGNPTRTVLPSGHTISQVYDAQGSLLASTDETLGGTTSFTYEPAFNQVTSITDPFNQTTSFDHDPQGNLTQITTPLNRIITFGYDQRNLVTSLVDPLGTPTLFTYNGNENPTQITQGSGSEQRVIKMGYTAEGNLGMMIDPLNRVFSFAYDPLGRLTRQTLPGDREISYSYDTTGNLISLTPPGRPAHIFSYTELGLLSSYTAPAVSGGGTNRTLYTYNQAQQLTQITRPDGLTLDYTYDNAGRLSNLIIPRGTLSYTYAPTTGQLSTLTAPDGINLTYSYNGDVTTNVAWSGPINGSVGYDYDELARVTRLDVNGSTPIDFTYNADQQLTQAGGLTLSYDAQSGLLSSTTLSGVTDAWGFNAFAELNTYSAAFNGASLYDVQYTRDVSGRITTKTETIGGQTDTYTYGYDAPGRLWTVTLNGTPIATYTYALNGNRLSDGAVTGTYDDQDRLLQYGSTTYSYTANGELLSKNESGQVTSYDYDVLGNLMAVTLSDSTQIDYLVDGQNRRIGKKVNGTLVQGFLYQDQLNPIAELDGNGSVVSRFIYANRTNVPDYMIKNGQTYRIVADHLASPRLVVDVATGAIVQRLDYDAFGVVLQDTNPGFQPFGFAGGLYDQDTGLVRFEARDYDAGIGRWTAKDPILFAGQDSNLYVYVRSDPINLADYTGMGIKEWIQAIGIALGLWTGQGAIGPKPPQDIPQQTQPAPNSGQGGGSGGGSGGSGGSGSGGGGGSGSSGGGGGSGPVPPFGGACPPSFIIFFFKFFPPGFFCKPGVYSPSCPPPVA